MTTPSRPPTTIAVSGAAGMLGYSLLFRLGVGRSFDATRPFRLNLLDLPHKQRNLEGVALELEDCALPLVSEINTFAHPRDAFAGANIIILVGANPRTIGMERADLLESNAPIFAAHGRDINDVAADDVRIIVAGNPVNTNTMIAAHHAPDIPRDRFTALMRLDHNRVVAQVAQRIGVPTSQVRRVCVWGNHSRTAYPDVTHAMVGNTPVLELIDEPRWTADYLEPLIADRGAQILETRGISSQGSAAHAALGQLRDWIRGTPKGDWTSVGIWSNGEYGVPEGLVSSFPVTSDGRSFRVVPGLEIDDYSRRRIDLSIAELAEEREHARSLGHLD